MNHLAPAVTETNPAPVTNAPLPFTARTTTEQEKNRLNRWIITKHNCEDHGLSFEEFTSIIEEHRALKTETREYMDPRNMAARTRLASILGQPVTGVLLREPTHPDSIHINYYQDFTFSREEQAWVEKNPHRVLKGENTRSSTGALAPELFTLSNLQALLENLAPDAEWVHTENINSRNNYQSDESVNAPIPDALGSSEVIAYISTRGEMPLVMTAAASYGITKTLAAVKIAGLDNATRVLTDLNAYAHAFINQ